jgi:hypothetical protein
VAPATGCSAADTFVSLHDALNSGAVASATTATITLGAVPYDENDDVYTGSTPLTITGAGEGKTVLDGVDPTAVGGTRPAVLEVNDADNAQVTVQNLSAVIPENVSGHGIGDDGSSDLTVQDVSVTDPASPGSSTGLALGGAGIARDVTVDMTAHNDAGVSGALLVDDSTITAPIGLEVETPGSAFRTTVSGTASAAVAVGATSFSADDCALFATNGADDLDDVKGTDVSITQSTLSGDGSGVGFSVDAEGSSGVDASLTDSIIDPVEEFAVELSGAGASFTNSFDDFRDATVPAMPLGGVTLLDGATFTPGTSNIDANPKFVTPGTDLRLLPGSPAMNQISTALGPDDSATDRLGNPRIVDGAPRDMGAYQHQAPTATGSVTPGVATVGKPIKFSATGSSVNPGDSFTYSWKFDDGATATGASVSHAFASAGNHHATVTVTGAGPAGFSTTAAASVKVTSTPPGKPTASHESLTGVAKRKPRLALTLTAGKGAALLKSIAVSLPKGLSFSKRAKSLVKGVAVKGAGGKRLKLTVKLAHGTLTLTLKTAASRAAISISGHALSATSRLAGKVKHKRAGRLQVRLKVTDAGHVTTPIAVSLKPK